MAQVWNCQFVGSWRGVLLVTHELWLLLDQIVKRLIIACGDSARFTVKSNSGFKIAHVRTQEFLMLFKQLVLLVGTLMLRSTILALRAGYFSVREELLFAVVGGLGLYLLVNLHLERAGCRRTSWLERIASALCQIFAALLSLVII